MISGSLARTLRVVLTIAMLVGIYRETGPVTTLMALLIAIRFEIEDGI